jgi:putative ABC transport system permease protein
MDLNFAFAARPALAAAAGGLALTVGLGMIGAFRVLGRKPAAYLREL